jgi:Uncharacterized protein conserved in bacteria (DUF2255)
VVIWVAVADDGVFVRSVRGTKRRWYRDRAAGVSGRLEFAGRHLGVQAIPVSDPAAGARASQEYLWKYQPSLQPLATDKMPLEVPPPRSSQFGSPLVLSRVHWCGPIGAVHKAAADGTRREHRSGLRPSCN